MVQESGVFSVEMLDVAAKADEFGVEAAELERLLTSAGVPIFPDGDRKGVTSASLKAFVANAIRHSGGATNDGMRHSSVARDMSSASGWGEERRKQLATYPETARLLNEFTSYLKQEEPRVDLRQNSWTLSIIMPGNRWAGLKPRGYGLYLYATREGRKLGHRIEGLEGFERALAWLRGLPKYK